MVGRLFLVLVVAAGLSAIGPEAGAGDPHASSESFFELKVRLLAALWQRFSSPCDEPVGFDELPRRTARTLGEAVEQLVATQRQVIAQTEGNVQDIYFREGEYLPASTPAVSILPPKNVFVRFFVPETEFARIQLGGKVRVTCDGCAAMDATVTFIAAREEFTQPVIFSVGNREKLVFKLEARAPDGLKLNPGQPVQVRPL